MHVSAIQFPLLRATFHACAGPDSLLKAALQTRENSFRNRLIFLFRQLVRALIQIGTLNSRVKCCLGNCGNEALNPLWRGCELPQDADAGLNAKGFAVKNWLFRTEFFGFASGFFEGKPRRNKHNILKQ